MRVCDFCKSEKMFPIKAIVVKEDGPQKKENRNALSIEMDMCDTCLTKFLKEFGRFIHRYRKDARDAPEGSKENLEESAASSSA